jgi:hypothetical protein
MKKLILTSAAVLTSLVMFGQTFENPTVVANEEDATLMDWFIVGDESDLNYRNIRMNGYKEDIIEYTQTLIEFFGRSYEDPDYKLESAKSYMSWEINNEYGEHYNIVMYTYNEFAEIVVTVYTEEEYQELLKYD